MKKLLLSALAVSVMFVSCNKDDDNPMPKPTKADVSAKGVYVDIYDIHENMYKKSSSELLGTFNKFKSDVAESTHADFTNWIKNVKPEGNASKGVAGMLGTPEKPRYVDGKGFENGQLIKKGLIGAYQLSKAMSEYGKMTPPNKLDKEEQQKMLENFATAILGSYDYIDNEKVEMESHGKKSMGYPVMNGNEFAKYLNVVSNYEQYKTLSDDLYKELRDAKKNVGDQRKLERNLAKALTIAQKVTAIRGIQYAKLVGKLKNNELDAGNAHGISEGLGFIYSLQFATYNPEEHAPRMSVTSDKVNGLLNKLDLWNSEEASALLEEFGKAVAKDFGFDYDQANL